MPGGRHTGIAAHATTRKIHGSTPRHARQAPTSMRRRSPCDSARGNHGPRPAPSLTIGPVPTAVSDAEFDWVKAETIAYLRAVPCLPAGASAMIETRVTKVVMVASLALFALLVT